MTPLASPVAVSDTVGRTRIMRYNGFLAADITGAAAPGYSSGEALAAMARLAGEVPPHGMRFDMIDVTVFGLLFTPVLYVAVRRPRIPGVRR